LLHLLIPVLVGVGVTAPWALVAMAFAIARDGSPLRRSFWSA
jgi:hypothetical protein